MSEPKTETEEFYELKAWVETLAVVVDKLMKRLDRLESTSTEE